MKRYMSKNMPENMPKTEHILQEMESLLDGLLENARKLLVLSKQVIEEEELTVLQKEQEALLSELIKKDSELHHLNEISKNDLYESRANIDAKIGEFQKLNAEFLENIRAAHGLIQFEKGRIKKHPKS